uniref:Uncharacterized protein n=1 Tax=Anguilla anguilla TaxID=7936 RepID=A0A0E9X204_ANGAN
MNKLLTVIFSSMAKPVMQFKKHLHGQHQFKGDTTASAAIQAVTNAPSQCTTNKNMDKQTERQMDRFPICSSSSTVSGI